MLGQNITLQKADTAEHCDADESDPELRTDMHRTYAGRKVDRTKSVELLLFRHRVLLPGDVRAGEAVILGK
jgi:hypothetical protein